MCRWIAYAGPEIYLEDLLFLQENSIASQSLKARESVLTTNGDGFGVAWYGSRPTAGLFKDVLPAWNDSNLRSLAAQVRSRLFFAHVRASTGTAVSRTNCHPFTWENWSFMHNGKIGNWEACRKPIEHRISTEYYAARQGTTDSEAMFLLALSLGLRSDPRSALLHMLSAVGDAMAACKASEPLRVSLALTDGKDIWAVRYSSDRQSPSLYYGWPRTGATELNTGLARCIVSEPLDPEATHWLQVEDGVGIHWSPTALTEFRVEP